MYRSKIWSYWERIRAIIWVLVLSLSMAGCSSVVRQVKASLGLDPKQELEAALTRTPEQWQEAISRAAAIDPKVTKGQHLEKDPSLNRKLQTMVDRLRSVSHAPKIPFRVKIIKSKQINAFNTGGELLYVYTGLIKYVKSDDELAGILAHEMGHGIGAHLQREQRSMLLPSLGAVLTNVALQNQTAEQVIGLANQALSSGYSRRHEREADILSVLYTYRAGYDPLSFEEFFERMTQKAQKIKQKKEKNLRKNYACLQQAAKRLQQKKQNYALSYHYFQAHSDSPVAYQRLQQAKKQLEESKDQHNYQYQQYKRAYQGYAQSISQIFPIFQSHPSDPERINIITKTLEYLKKEIPLSQTPPSVQYVMSAVEEVKKRR